MKKHFMIACLFFLVSNCFSQQKHKLRLDGLYYWDNKKDTIIIKDSSFTEAFRNALIDDGTFENTGTSFPGSGKITVYGSGSRCIVLYRFYEDRTYVYTFMNEKFDLEKAKNIIEINRAADIKMNIKNNQYALRNDEVYFEQDWSKSFANQTMEYEGIPWTKPLKVMYTGTIMEDSIRFVITSTFPPGRTPLFGGKDTVRVFQFVKFPK